MDIHYHKGSTWTKYLSTGTSFVKSTHELVECERDNSYFLQDVDGDGISDFIERSYLLKIWLNRNNAFQYQNDYIGGTDFYKIIPSSMVKTNYHNFLLAVAGSQLFKINYTRRELKQRLLTGIVNSFGVVQTNYYQRLNDKTSFSGGGFYIQGNGSIFPYIDFLGPLWAVSQQNSLLNGTTLQSLFYSYTHAILHQQGMGFKGFEKISIFDSLRGRYSTNTFAPTNYGVPVSEITPFSETTYIYSVQVAANKKIKRMLGKLVTKDLLKNITVTKSYKYDSYCNPISEFTKYEDRVSTNVIKTIKTFSYSNTNTTSQYLIGLPVQTVTTESRNDSSWVQSQNVEYKSGTALVANSTRKVNGNQVERTEWTYDSYGNVLTEKSKPYSKSLFLGITYTYDSKHRYVSTEKDALNHTTTYSSYNKFGAPEIVKDFKQHTTTYHFDDLGRVSSVRYPDSTSVRTSRIWNSSVGAYYVSQTSTGKPLVHTFYDALNREVRKREQCFDGFMRTVDTKYDDYGRVEKVSLPSRSTPSFWNINTYDDYDRIIKVVEATGRITTTSYSGNSATVVQDGVSSTRTFDKSGLLASVTDACGTVTYDYRPDQQLRETVAPGSVTTSISYDEYGRQIKIVDPSAGTKKYTYDDSGNVSTETDANGKVIKMIYDNYDRQLQREYVGELITNYVYNADGLLASEQSNNGTKKEYSYDEYLRVSSEKESFNTLNLAKTYSYSNGNVSAISYSHDTNTASTPIGYESHIYTNGSLSEIKWNGNTTVWKLNSENQYGQPTSCTTGGLTRTYSFDSAGRPTARMAKYGSRIIQNFSYSFSPQTGNLLWRKDNTRNLQENFGYDNLNRLTSFGGKVAAYDNRGNIIRLSDVGLFQYSNYRPYAISSITPTINCRIPSEYQSVAYNSMMHPKGITQNGDRVDFVYNGNGDRVRMDLQKPNQPRIVGGYKTYHYYLGGRYETVENAGEALHKEMFYIGGDAYNAPAVYVKEGTDTPWILCYILRDYLGSITHLTSAQGGLIQELSYDAWGNLRDPNTQVVYPFGNEPALFLGRGYTGHEHLTAFGLINMNARLYDPMLGRFMSPDPFVQAPENGQNFNRYSYCLNNPLRYTDENGEFFFSLFLGPFGACLDVACWGALIGAGTSATVYSISVLATGQSWNGGDFWKSVGIGALGGAIGAGMGHIGSLSALGTFGNSIGYNMLSEISNTVITNCIFGNDMNWGSMMGMAAGAAAGSFLPTFKGGVKGQNLKNALLETGFNTVRGTATGFVAGGVEALVNNDADYIWQGMAGGAIGGAGRSLFMNLAFGAPYKAEAIYENENGKTVVPALQRDGGVLNIWGDITIGRNASSRDGRYAEHETVHVLQQSEMGWATFYGKTVSQYIKSFIKTGSWDNVYHTPGTLEYDAEKRMSKIKIKL